MKKGAIFDMDGLLLDTERIWQEVWQEIASVRGVELGPGFARAISGTSGRKAAEVCAQYYRTDVETGDEIYHQSLRLGTEKLRVNVPRKPGSEEILSGLKKMGFRIAVASSSPMELIRSNLALAGLDSYEDVFVSGVGLPHGKPAPDIFLKAADEIELEPQECYVFEDSFNGIRAGHAAGCASVMIPDLMRPDEEMRRLSVGIYPTLSEALRAIKEGEI